MKKLICIALRRGEDEKTYIYPDLFDWIDKPELYLSHSVIQGKTAIVQVISDDHFTEDEMKDAAIKFMTGRFSRWTFSLSEDEPKWRKVK